jgi:transposase
MKKQTLGKFNAAYKAKVALEAVRNQKTLAEFLGNLSVTFENSDSADSKEIDSKDLYATTGQLKVENEFLKKSCKKLGIEI